MLTLFPDQIIWKNNCNDALDEYRSVVGYGPTGFGKTTVVTKMMADAKDLGHRSFISVPRKEIAGQISKALHQEGLSHGFYVGGYPMMPEEMIQIGTPTSLLSRIKKYGTKYTDFSLLIDDECHNAIAPIYRACYEHLHNVEFRLGLSATPGRLDGRGLSEGYKKLIMGPQIAELIKLGRLVQPIVYSPPVKGEVEKLEKQGSDYTAISNDAAFNNGMVAGNAVEQYEKFVAGMSTIVFCATIDHARSIAKEFSDKGWNAASLDGEMSRKDRDDVVERFRKGEIRVLASCELITEGFDAPGVECVIFLRKTLSLRLYLQAIGRSLRTAPGKTRAVILDLVGNVWHHGMPDADREWTLVGGSCGTKDKRHVKQCMGCYRWVGFTAKGCACGKEFTGKEKKIRTDKDGTLVEVGGVKTKVLTKNQLFKMETKGAASFDVVRKAAEKYGYSVKYAQMRWKWICRGRAMRGKK